MIWLDAIRYSDGVAGVLNADYVVFIRPSYDGSRSSITDRDGVIYSSKTPYAELRTKLRSLKNKETT